MNITAFFEHWGVRENPFRAEEARQDAVFHRLDDNAVAHPDLEKIVGDPDLPATAIVFGEKGSGKTAIRLQLQRRIDEHNRRDPERRLLLIAYDDLNPTLERFCDHVGPAVPRRALRRKESADTTDDTLARLRRLRLVDHMDAILHVAVGRLVDALIAPPSSVDPALGPLPARELRRAAKSDPGLKRDLMLLQVAYDRPDAAVMRTHDLRRRIGAPRDWHGALWTALAVGGIAVPVAVGAAWIFERDRAPDFPWLWALVGALAFWLVLIAKRAVWDRARLRRAGRKLSRQVRVLNRSSASYAEAVALMPVRDRSPAVLPMYDGDEQRYEMFARLRRVLRPFGYTSLVVVMDRVDEPTLVSGDADRMQAIVWPILNNKLLQMEGVAFKLLLPIELRHALFRESSAFFQSARLDKQNLVERLQWTGATLYDLCNARLQACRRGAESSIGLVDIFENDVTRNDIVDALDQMRQPRDAFKFLYQCIQEHCSRVPQEQAAYRIPKIVLDVVRKQQADRVQQLSRGLRPA